MRRGAKKDLFHRAVADLFAQHQWSVLDLSRVGDGVPDILICRGAFAALIEVKSHNSVRHGVAKEPLNEKQREFRHRWSGAIFTVASLEEAWRVLDTLKLRRWENDEVVRA